MTLVRIGRKDGWFVGRGKARKRMVYLPAGKAPLGACWSMHSGNALGNTWFKMERAGAR